MHAALRFDIPLITFQTSDVDTLLSNLLLQAFKLKLALLDAIETDLYLVFDERSDVSVEFRGIVYLSNIDWQVYPL